MIGGEGRSGETKEKLFRFAFCIIKASGIIDLVTEKSSAKKSLGGGVVTLRKEEAQHVSPLTTPRSGRSLFR
jgi:hypothetical protein